MKKIKSLKDIKCGSLKANLVYFSALAVLVLVYIALASISISCVNLFLFGKFSPTFLSGLYTIQAAYIVTLIVDMYIFMKITKFLMDLLLNKFESFFKDVVKKGSRKS